MKLTKWNRTFWRSSRSVTICWGKYRPSHLHDNSCERSKQPRSQNRPSSSNCSRTFFGECTKAACSVSSRRKGHSSSSRHQCRNNCGCQHGFPMELCSWPEDHDFVIAQFRSFGSDSVRVNVGCEQEDELGYQCLSGERCEQREERVPLGMFCAEPERHA
jgi:hypothetical protein